MSARLFKSLLLKSAKIQQQIDAEQQRRWPDTLRLLKLKKLRLLIMDRLHRISEAAVPRHRARLVPVRIATRSR